MDSRIKGGERAIVRTGEYDAMLPMDIYGEFLIKAIISGDIDKMEQLGIYEIAPEDFALAVRDIEHQKKGERAGG